MLVRTDAATGGGFKAFISPPFKAAGVDVVGDVAIATGSTDYAPYVADIQRSDPDAVLLPSTTRPPRNSSPRCSS